MRNHTNRFAPWKPSCAISRRISGYLEQPAAPAVEDGNGHWFRFVIDTASEEFDWEPPLRGRFRQRGWSSAVVDDIVTQCDQQHALLRHLRQRGFLRAGC